MCPNLQVVACGSHVSYRRLPVVFAMHRFIHQIEEVRQAIFVGFFGPIGVSAVFYIYVSLAFLDTITVDGIQREDAAQLGQTLLVVVWFLAICSIVRIECVTRKASANRFEDSPWPFYSAGEARFLSTTHLISSLHITR